jgi:hypothetical protein
MDYILFAANKFKPRVAFLRANPEGRSVSFAPVFSTCIRLSTAQALKTASQNRLYALPRADHSAFSPFKEGVLPVHADHSSGNHPKTLFLCAWSFEDRLSAFPENTSSIFHPEGF